MRRVLCVLALGAALATASLAVPGEAFAHGRRHWHRHHHHHYGIYGWWWGPRVVVAPPYWAPWPHPPPVVPQAPGPYIERPDPPVEGYWYYCESAGGYYPRILSCPEPWVKVPPRPE